MRVAYTGAILGNKFNVLPHTLTWLTKCYMTPQNQEGTDTFLTLKCGMTPFLNSNRTLPSISIIQRTSIKAKRNNLKTPTSFEHGWSTVTKELPPMSHMPKLFLNILKTLKTPCLSFLSPKTCLSSLDLFAKRLSIWTSLGQWKPLSIPWPNLVNDGPTHSLHNWFNLTCLNILFNQFPVTHINKNTAPLLSTPPFLDLCHLLPPMANPALLSSNLHLFKDLLLPPLHQGSLESLTSLLFYHPSTSHIKKSCLNGFKTYPFKDIQHRQQILMNGWKSDSWRPSL